MLDFVIRLITKADRKGTRNARRGLKEVEKGAKDTKRELGQMGSVGKIALGNLVSQGVTSFFRGLRRRLVGTGKDTIRAAADMEAMRTQLRGLMATVQEADQAFEESIAFSDRTPFEPDEIIRVRALLESVGIKGPEAVEDVAQAAAAMNKNIEDVARTLISLETEPLRNLGIQFKKAGDEFEFTFTEKSGKVQKVIANDMETARLAVREIFNQRFGQEGLEAASRTFNGILSTFRGKMRLAMAEVGEGLLPPLKEALDQINARLARLKDNGGLKAFGKTLGDKAQEFADTVKASAKAAKDLFDELREQEGSIGGAFEKVGENIAGKLADAGERAGRKLLIVFLDGLSKHTLFKGFGKNADRLREQEVEREREERARATREARLKKHAEEMGIEIPGTKGFRDRFNDAKGQLQQNREDKAQRAQAEKQQKDKERQLNARIAELEQQIVKQDQLIAEEKQKAAEDVAHFRAEQEQQDVQDLIDQRARLGNSGAADRLGGRIAQEQAEADAALETQQQVEQGDAEAADAVLKEAIQQSANESGNVAKIIRNMIEELIAIQNGDRATLEAELNQLKRQVENLRT